MMDETDELPPGEYPSIFMGFVGDERESSTCKSNHVNMNHGDGERLMTTVDDRLHMHSIAMPLMSHLHTALGACPTIHDAQQSAFMALPNGHVSLLIYIPLCVRHHL